MPKPNAIAFLVPEKKTFEEFLLIGACQSIWSGGLNHMVMVLLPSQMDAICES